MAPPPAAKSDFLRKFENRLSVVGRDGTVTKVGEDANAAGAPPVDSSVEDMGGITRMHPALAEALLGKPETSWNAPKAPSPTRSPVRAQVRASQDSSLGSFAPPPTQQTVV